MFLFICRRSENEISKRILFISSFIHSVISVLSVRLNMYIFAYITKILIAP